VRTEVRIAPGVVSDDTPLTAKGRWIDASNVRFVDGCLEVIGGWESVTWEKVLGVCRTVFQWTDTEDVPSLNIAFGSHSHLQVWMGGVLYDVTPTLALPAQTLGKDPLEVADGQSVVTVTQPGHPYEVGDELTVAGADEVGGITPNGDVTVTAVTADTWSFDFGSAATSDATGGGDEVVVTPKRPFSEGMIDGTGGSGFGTGAWDVGAFGMPSTADYFPRTWSFGAWGGELIGAPRGGTIYHWANDTGAKAVPVKNAPAKVKAVLVSHTDQVFALGCNEEASGLYNPLCIRHSGIRRLNEWTTLTPEDSTAREYILPGGGEIVSGRNMGPYILVWTTNALFVGYYAANLAQPWKFERVAENCGLIGPNAAVVVGQRAVWLGPDMQFRIYNFGGQPEIIPCPIRHDFAANLTPSQADKIVASSVSRFGEVRFDYPDVRDGFENSRYVVVSLQTGLWTRGVMARTAMVDAGPSENPIGVAPDGSIYWHERGQSADGAPLSWHAETGELYLDPNTSVMIRSLWPDVAGQVGPWNLTLITRRRPNGRPRVVGPKAFASTTEKVDLRVDGRLFRLRLSGASSPAAGRLGTLVFDTVRTSSR